MSESVDLATMRDRYVRVRDGVGDWQSAALYASVNDVPALLALVEQQAGEIERLKTIITRGHYALAESACLNESCLWAMEFLMAGLEGKDAQAAAVEASALAARAALGGGGA